MYDVPKMLIVKEKIGDYHFLIVSNLSLHWTCVRILECRLKNGWYDYEPERSVLEELGRTERELLDFLPDSKLKNIATSICEEIKQHNDGVKKHEHFVKNVEMICDDPHCTKEESKIKLNGNNWIDKKRAYNLLCIRNRHEYEEVELVDFNTIERYVDQIV